MNVTTFEIAFSGARRPTNATMRALYNLDERQLSDIGVPPEVSHALQRRFRNPFIKWFALAGGLAVAR